MSKTLQPNKTSPTLDVQNPQRRAILSAGALGLAGLLLAGRADAKSAKSKKSSSARQGTAFDPTKYWMSPTGRLVRRVSYGGQSDFVSADGLGYNGYLQQQLNYSAIADTKVENWLKLNIKTYGYTNYQLVNLPAATRWGQALADLQREALIRAIYSNRQLFERVVEFWFDHFNVDYGTVDIFTIPYLRDVIRKYAMGSFYHLLAATAESAAMMDMLNTNTNSKWSPNQNYARELMELHTMGINGGYTQTDVEEVARCFTGWTYGYDPANPVYGNFYFNVEEHDQGTKTIFAGTKNQLNIPSNGGIQDGISVLQAVATHPSTAVFICTKLCSWFLGDNVPAATIANVVKVWSQTGGGIPYVLAEILKQSNVVASEVKFKRPFHLVASAMRATDATFMANQDINTLDYLAEEISQMGMPLFQWTEPNGYTDNPIFWMSNMLPRLSGTFNILNRGEGKLITFPKATGPQATPSQVILDINAFLFNLEMSPALATELNVVLETLLTSPNLVPYARTESFALALTSLDFQYY